MALNRGMFGRLALGMVVSLSVACGDDDDGGDARNPDGGGEEDGGRVDSGTMAGRGGSGGAGGRGGTGGQMSGRPDAGQDSGPPDPCEGVEDSCENEGVRCRNDELVVCAENDDGCLVETTTDCTEGDTNFCDSEGSPAECAFDPCLDVENPCEDEGTSCDNDDITLVTCAEDENGCLVETETNCTDDEDNNSCAEASGAASCVKDECKTAEGEDKQNVCVIDELTCQANILVDCVDDADGCPIATRTDCTMPGPTCTGGACNECAPGDSTTPPACVHNPCKGLPNLCLTEGVTCMGRSIATCAPDSNQCLVETLQMCGEGDTCMDAGGTPTCMDCVHAPECAAVSEGAMTCDPVNDRLATCTDTDDDGCRELVTESCGENHSCDVTNGCVYDGDEECTIHATLRNSGSYGPYLTMDAGNDYNNYQCPGLIFPFAGAAPDLLFAVDVSPNTAIELTLTGVTGFTGSGAWMTQLSQCQAANSEAGCQALGNRVIRYSNDTETTARIFVVVDADNPQNGTNQGTFGLELDTHEIECGDGKLDGDEACDDGDREVGDGCTPTCTLEEGFLCTDASPSVCTTRPEEEVCGNVACPALPGGGLGEVCCTADQTCGVALGLIYGNACILRNQPGVEDEACPDETGFFGLSMLQGCCRPDDKCGLLSTSGGGCMERTNVWLNMEDGLGEFLYDGPFEAVDCTHPD